MITNKPFSISFVLFILLSIGSIAQKTPFTTADAIKVKSLGNQQLSNDGKYVAGIITDGSARFDLDHFRFQDPSYLHVGQGEVVVINTTSGEQLKPYATLTRVTTMAWAPNNTELAFLEMKAGKLQLMVYDVLKKKVREVKIAGSPLLTSSSLMWTPDSKSIVLHARDGGWLAKAMALYNEATKGPVVVYEGSKPFLKWDEIRNTNGRTTVLKVNSATGVAEKLLNESSYSGLAITQDGKHLIFTENFPIKTAYERNEGTDYKVAYLDLTKQDSAKVIYKRNKKRRDFIWSESKMKYAWVDSGYVYIKTLGKADSINLTKGKAYEDEKKKKHVKFTVMRWSPKEGQMLLSSDKGYWLADIEKDTLMLVYALPTDAKEKEKAPTLNLLNWTDDERYLYFSYSAKDVWKRGFVRFDLQQKKMEDILLDNRLYTGVEFAKRGETVTLNLSDGDLPSNVVVTDKTFSSMKPITDLNPWMANKKLTRSELITYRNVDGKELKGILYYPVDYDPGKKYPLICEIYEEFFANGYNRNMNLFANQGYFALRPSVDLEQGYPGEAWVKGITSAINKLVDEGKVDNDKVGVQGGSYGGYATSLLITQTNRFAAAINISGKVNIISFLGDSPKIGTRNYSAAENGQDRIGGSLWDEPLKYLATTAVLYADRIKTPHLILTGEGDWNVPGVNSRELYYAMRRLGKDVTWVNYMNGGHGAGAASNESDFYDHWNRVFDFYEKNFNKKDKKDKPKEPTSGN
jgi:dipeptidyl aminopeptidase/acylaminoacyl peptidase